MVNKKIARVKEYVWTGDSDESIKRYDGGTFMWAIEYESPYNVCDRECFYINELFTQITWKYIPRVIKDYIADATIVDIDDDCIDVKIYTYESNKDSNV